MRVSPKTTPNTAKPSTVFVSNDMRSKLGVHGPFISRGRAAGEAPGVLIKPMQQPIYKPPAWVAPIR